MNKWNLTQLSSVPRSSGVYRIMREGRSYVGATKDLNARARGHVKAMKDQLKCSYAMKDFWNGANAKDTFFEVLEFCDKQSLPVREHHWIKELSPSLNTRINPDGFRGVTVPVNQTKGPPIYLREGVPGTNLIRRFQEGREVAPVYVPRRGDSRSTSLAIAAEQAISAGYDSFGFEGGHHEAITWVQVPEQAESSAA